MTAKILAFNGSLRADSWNYKLVSNAGRAAGDAGARVSYLHLKDLPMPIYSEELEAECGLPENARRFKELLIAHDGFLIASPEYNSSITAALKNAIDWASRREQDESPLVAFSGKTACLISASPGGLGGLRGLVHLRSILSNMGVIVIPQQFALPEAHKQFDQEGVIIDSKVHSKVQSCAVELVAICNKIYSA